jgi:hypothetical protein
MWIEGLAGDLADAVGDQSRATERRHRLRDGVGEGHHARAAPGRHDQGVLE